MIAIIDNKRTQAGKVNQLHAKGSKKEQGLQSVKYSLLRF